MATERIEAVQRARELRAKKLPWSDIAMVLRQEHGFTPLRAMRLAHGWAQTHVAELISSTQSRVSLHEKGQERGTNPSRFSLELYAQVYQCDIADLVQGVGQYSCRDEYAGPVKRRDVLVGGLAVGGTAATSPTTFLTFLADMFPREPTGRIGHSDVARYRELVWQVDDLQAVKGGAAAFDTAAKRLGELVHASTTAECSEPVRRELQRVVGLAHHLTAYCAFDAASHETARQNWAEAKLYAEMAGDLPLTIWTLCQLSLQAGQLGNGRHAADLAEAAVRAAHAGGLRSPQLWAFVEARNAFAAAVAGDKRRAEMALGRSAELVADDDLTEPPIWQGRNQWRGEDNWQASAVPTYMSLGSYDVAIRLADQLGSSTGPPARQALVATWRARALAGAGEIDGAAEAATAAARHLAGIESPRMASLLRGVRPLLQPHARVAGVDEALAALERV